MPSAVGLITEYNPFHNGHLHHLQQSRRLAGAEVAVAVMSGHFLQRGEPALVDKWLRTRMALTAGVDVVVELPLPWACNSAPHFAVGAVRCLEALGGIETLCFGSEAGALVPLQHCADFLLQHQQRIETEIARLLRQGISYPAAREQVVRSLADERVDPELLSSPNNILGIEYLKALQQTASPLRPLTVPRLGAGYHDQVAVGHIASATGIRKLLAEGQGVADYLPPEVAELLADALVAGETVNDQLLLRLQLAGLLIGRDALESIYQVDAGLAARLFLAAQEATGYPDLVEKAKFRQLTRTRVQRALAYALLGIDRPTMATALEAGPLYLQLLGCSERGAAFLAATRKRRQLPLVQNLSRVHATLTRRYGRDTPLHKAALAQLKLQLHATRVYSLLVSNWTGGNRSRDFFQELIRV